MKKGAQMNLQTFRQNKKIFFLLLILFYIGLLFFGQMSLPYFLTSVTGIFLLLITIAGGSVSRFSKKDRNFAAVWGFLPPAIMGVISALSIRMIDSAPQYPEFYFYQILAFVRFLPIGFSGAAVGWMATSNDENKTKRYVQYGLACIFLMITVYLLLNLDLVYWTMFSILRL